MTAGVANYKQLNVEQGVVFTFKDTQDKWVQWIIKVNRTAGNIKGLQEGNFAPNMYLTCAQPL